MLTHFVEFLVELVKLCRFRHLILVHHEWWLDFLVSLFSEEVKTVGNQRLVEVDAVICQKITPMTCDFGTYGRRIRPSWLTGANFSHPDLNPWRRVEGELRDAA